MTEPVPDLMAALEESLAYLHDDQCERNEVARYTPCRCFDRRHPQLGRTEPAHEDAGNGWCTCGRRAATCWK